MTRHHLLRFPNSDNESVWSELRQFIKDTVRPIISILTPASPSYHNSPIDISGVAADADQTPITIKYVHLYYQKIGGDGADGSMNIENSSSTEPFNYSYLWTPPSDGNYKIGARAEDKAINLSNNGEDGIAYDKSGNVSDIMTEHYGIAPVISQETVMAVNVGQTSATINWTTDDLSTSRVVYDTVSHSALGSPENYDYANSTIEDLTKVTNHSVVVNGLIPGTTYYIRTISAGSPQTVSGQISFGTGSPAPSGGGGGGGGGGILTPFSNPTSSTSTSPNNGVVAGTSTFAGLGTGTGTGGSESFLGSLNQILGGSGSGVNGGVGVNGGRGETGGVLGANIFPASSSVALNNESSSAAIQGSENGTENVSENETSSIQAENEKLSANIGSIWGMLKTKSWLWITILILLILTAAWGFFFRRKK
ncbi:fibronectin type III domain-containing protein [Candidatus Wolfebacteria bacterium]|nr:fibronectin type III domain-containing protein [Candidatus Wolfebacteria bacterium]